MTPASGRFMLARRRDIRTAITRVYFQIKDKNSRYNKKPEILWEEQDFSGKLIHFIGI